MENVGGVRVVVGGEAGEHGVPQQLKEVGVDSGESILDDRNRVYILALYVIPLCKLGLYVIPLCKLGFLHSSLPRASTPPTPPFSQG